VRSARARSRGGLPGPPRLLSGKRKPLPMTIKLASLAANLKKEAEGDWIVSPDFPGVRFHVRSSNIQSYTEKRDQLLHRLVKKYQGKAIPADVKAREFGSLVAEELLIDWDGLDVAYSADVALNTLTDPAFREVLQNVEWCASRVGQAEVEWTEGVVKNSAPPSATT
jgi:hypothetical protein